MDQLAVEPGTRLVPKNSVYCPGHSDRCKGLTCPSANRTFTVPVIRDEQRAGLQEVGLAAIEPVRRRRVRRHAGDIRVENRVADLRAYQRVGWRGVVVLRRMGIREDARGDKYQRPRVIESAR